MVETVQTVRFLISGIVLHESVPGHLFLNGRFARSAVTDSRRRRTQRHPSIVVELLGLLLLLHFSYGRRDASGLCIVVQQIHLRFNSNEMVKSRDFNLSYLSYFFLITVSAPKRWVHFSIRTATRAGTCLEAVASALSARAELSADDEPDEAAGRAVNCGAQSKLGPTQTARFDADIILCEELAVMCTSTHKKWRSSVTLALGNRSHNLKKKREVIASSMIYL